MTKRYQALNYSNEKSAHRAMKRLLKRYPVHPDCKVEVVASTEWHYPRRYLIRVTGRDGCTAYWSRA